MVFHVFGKGYMKYHYNITYRSSYTMLFCSPFKMSQAFMTEQIFIMFKRLENLDKSINLVREVQSILFMKFIRILLPKEDCASELIFL